MTRTYEVTINENNSLGGVLDGTLTIDEGAKRGTFLTKNKNEVATVDIQTDDTGNLQFDVNVTSTFTFNTQSTDGGQKYNGTFSGPSAGANSADIRPDCDGDVTITVKP